MEVLGIIIVVILAWVVFRGMAGSLETSAK